MASQSQLKPIQVPAPADALASFERMAALTAGIAGLTAAVGALRARRRTAPACERLRGAMRSHAAPPPGAPPARCRLAAAAFEDLAGRSHGLDYTPAGTAFRWAWAGQVARFKVVVDRSVPVSVHLELVPAGRLSEDDLLTAEIDGMAYPFLPDGGTGGLVAGPVAPRAGLAPTEIAVHVPAMFAPAPGAGGDLRPGVAISGIAVEPAD